MKIEVFIDPDHSQEFEFEPFQKYEADQRRTPPNDFVKRFKLKSFDYMRNMSTYRISCPDLEDLSQLFTLEDLWTYNKLDTNVYAFTAEDLIDVSVFEKTAGMWLMLFFSNRLPKFAIVKPRLASSRYPIYENSVKYYQNVCYKLLGLTEEQILEIQNPELIPVPF